MARCPVCGRFYRPVDRLAEARADQFIEPCRRHGTHSPRSHGDVWRRMAALRARIASEYRDSLLRRVAEIRANLSHVTPEHEKVCLFIHPKG